MIILIQRFRRSSNKVILRSSFTKHQSFNHAFLIIWSFDLNCQCSGICGTCVDPLKYPSPYRSSLLQSKLHTRPVAGRSVQPPAGVLGRIPLCMQLISSDCISFITIFRGSLNSQILILIIFLKFFSLYIRATFLLCCFYTLFLHAYFFAL